MAGQSQQLTLEEKVDACLILLRMLATQDSFFYTMHNKSPMWIRAIHAAEKVAAHVSSDVAKAHPECVMEILVRDSRPVDITPIQMVPTVAKDRDLSEVTPSANHQK